MSFNPPPFFLGDTDKQRREDEEVSESKTVLSVDVKETDNKGVLFSKISHISCSFCKLKTGFII